MHSRCRHFVAILLCAAGALACAGPAQTTAPARTPEAAPPPRLTDLREEFDPEPYRDGLLIQPEFGPPAASRSLDRPTDLAPPELRVRPEPATDDAFDDTTGGALEPAPTAPDSIIVYRVQIMALSSEPTARALADELGRRLAAPVVVQPQGELFMVRAGESTSPTVIEALRVRLVGLSREYADAYVITEHVAVEGTWDGDPDTTWAPTADLPPPGEAPAPVAVELVRTSGWRVLLDQFQGYKEATSFHQSALRRLQRNGIDHAVEVVFSAPWYKVEVGSFRTSSQAQQLVERVKGLGYRNALKVRDEVYLPKGGE